MSKALHIVGIGEALWDIFPEKSHFGGAPANFAIHAAALAGAAGKSHLISSLGKDDWGQKALEVLSNRGVDTHSVQLHPTRSTGEVRVTLDKDCTPQFRFIEDPAWDELLTSASHATLAESCQAVNFGTLAQQSAHSIKTTRAFLKNCPSHCIRLFDLNLRGQFWSPKLILDSLELASALKCNEEELVVLSEITGMGSDSPESFLKELIQRYQLQFAALTLGSQGSLIVTESQADWNRPPSVMVIDTTGAGDSFVAALIVGLLRKIPLPELHQKAGQIAAYVCTQQGATPPLPEELISFFENQK